MRNKQKYTVDRKEEGKYELFLSFLSLLCVPATSVPLMNNNVMLSGRFNLTISPARKEDRGRSKEKVRNEEAHSSGLKLFKKSVNL